MDWREYFMNTAQNGMTGILRAPTKRERWVRYWQKAARNWQLYVLVLPAIVTVFIFHYIPIYGVQIAFKNFRASKGIWGSAWVGMKNFKRFISYPYFWEILWNTVAIQLYAIATFPCSFIFSLMVNELRGGK